MDAMDYDSDENSPMVVAPKVRSPPPPRQRWRGCPARQGAPHEEGRPRALPVAPPQAKAKAAKGAAPLGPSNSNVAQHGKSIEEIYQKKSQLEHILLRPDTYIGSTEKQQHPMWVHDGEKLVFKSIDYVPGMYKIFDEILVNAADNKIRDGSMDTVKVEIDVVSRERHTSAAGSGQRAGRGRVPGAPPAGRPGLRTHRRRRRRRRRRGT
jgi:hypothetical protein